MFLCSAPWINGWVRQSWGWWFETPSCSLWRHRNYADHSWFDHCQPDWIHFRTNIRAARLMKSLKISYHKTQGMCACLVTVPYEIALTSTWYQSISNFYFRHKTFNISRYWSVKEYESLSKGYNALSDVCRRNNIRTDKTPFQTCKYATLSEACTVLTSKCLT